MFNKINFKAFYVGFVLLAIDIFIIWQKISYLYSDSKHHRVVSQLNDTFIGYIFYFILFILSLSIISYSFSFKNKFSNLGKYIYELIRDIIVKQLGKK